MAKKKKHFIYIMIKIIIAIILTGLSYFTGNNFDYFRIKVTGDKDVTIYREICESVCPLFKMGFDNGNFKFSILQEINGLFYNLFSLNFENPVTFLENRFCIIDAYYTAQGLDKGLNTKYSGLMDGKGEKYLSSESSLEYQGESEGNETWSEKSGSLTFTKECDIRFDAVELLGKPLKFNFDKKGPKVLIYHTHPSETYSYESGGHGTALSNGKKASSDAKENSVVQVGEALALSLKRDYGIEVIHNATIHDRPDARYAYNNALWTVSNILKSYPSIQVVIDIHRDALSESGKFRPVVKLKEKEYAKVMMVVGTSFTGNTHPLWKENLSFAMILNKKLEEFYPGITRAIYISKYRYNQHMSNHAVIVEVGGDGNTLKESLESAKALAMGIASILKS